MSHQDDKQHNTALKEQNYEKKKYKRICVEITYLDKRENKIII